MKGTFDIATLSIENSEAGIRRSLDHCLSAVDGVKFIDLYEPARVDPKVPIEDTIRVLA
jgi:pyridoxine 4-dehydrogenase